GEPTRSKYFRERRPGSGEQRKSRKAPERPPKRPNRVRRMIPHRMLINCVEICQEIIDGVIRIRGNITVEARISFFNNVVPRLTEEDSLRLPDQINTAEIRPIAGSEITSTYMEFPDRRKIRSLLETSRQPQTTVDRFRIQIPIAERRICFLHASRTFWCRRNGGRPESHKWIKQ